MPSSPIGPVLAAPAPAIRPIASLSFLAGSVLMALAAAVTTALVAVGQADGAALHLLVFATLGALVFATLGLFARSWIVLGVFLLLVTQPLFVVYFDHIVGDVDPVWPGIFPNRLMAAPIRLLLVQVQALISATLFALAVLRPADYRRAPALTFNAVGITLSWILCGFFTLAMLATALTTTRDAFMNDVQGGDRFVMTMGIIMIAVGSGIGSASRNRAMHLLSIFCLGAALLMALSGYRSILVFAATSFAAGFLSRRRLGVLQLVGLILLVLLAYEMMSYLSLLRATGVSVGDLLTGKGQWPDPTETSSRSGLAEQISIFTVYYANASEHYYGMTYLYAFVRALPNSIYTMFPYPPRIQDIFVEGGPGAFAQVGLNLGAYFFAESILNFGTKGAVVFSAITVAVLAWIEQGRFRSPLRQLMYPGLAMMMPGLALYGSANFVKQALTIFAVVLVLRLVGLVGDGRRLALPAPAHFGRKAGA